MLTADTITDEQLADELACSTTGGLGGAAALDLEDHGPHEAAGRGSGSLTREHVERVVMDEIERASSHDDWHCDPAPIARRVADRLSAPILSAEDVAAFRFAATCTARHALQSHPARILLDRLIAGARP